MTQDPGPVNLVWGNSGNGQTWNVGAATNWTYAGASVACANQENVTFDDTSNNTAPITLSSVVQPGSITVNASQNNYTITGTGSIGGSGVLRLLLGNTSTFTLDTANTYTGGTIVDGGTLVIGAAGALPANSSLTINGGTTKLAAGTGQASLSSLAISGTGVLDITDNSLAINYASGHSPAAAIRGLLTTGYDNDTWKGPGIDSSAAALNPGLFAIGYADGTVDAGTAAAKNQVLIEYTLAGDANLDGTVNFADLLVVAQNFNHVVDTHGNPIDWADGDFNYDGVVNFADLLLVAQNFNKHLSAGQLEQLPGSFSTEWNLALADVAAAQSNNVPEPGTVSLMALGGFTLLRRRRK
jgi:autotransporter-associated beta strand protein